MKFSFNTKYFISGLLIILFINYSTFLGISNTQESSSNSSSSNLKVELGSIKKSIEVSGTAELIDEQSLKFNKVGTVTGVYFKDGDSIKNGDLIAEIDNSDAQNTIEEAKISLENAQISLEQLYEDPDETNILQSKNSITSEENSLEISKQEFENLKITQKNSLQEILENIETSKKDLENQKASLKLAKKDLEISIKDKENSFNTTNINKSSTITNIEDNFKSYIIDIDKAIEESDYIMGVTTENKTKNDTYENYLGAKNSITKSKAKSSLFDLILLNTQLKKDLDKYNYSGNKEEIITLLNSYLEIYNKIYETTDLIYKTAEASIESIGSLTQSQIDSIKNTMSSYRTSSLSKISSIKSSINTLNTLTDTDLIFDSNSSAIASKQESIKSQELSIQKAELNIKNTQISYEETIASYKLTLYSKQKDLYLKQNSLELAKLNYDKLFAGPTTENVRKANNSIKQAQLKLDSSYKNLDDYKLIAPFDGVIRKIDYMTGDNLTTDTDKYVYIENPNLLEITVMLDQIDIVGIELGMDVTVAFDAYSTTPIKAKISSINTTPVSSSGVVSYEIKLILNDDNFNEKILSGFTADVEIITQSKDNILLLKTSAINEKDGKYYVNLVQNGKTIETEVGIGIASDGKTEIIFGLEEGDEISIKEFISSSTTDSTKNSTTLFGSPSGDRNMSGPPGGF